MGLSVSDAVRVFLMRVVADKQMPTILRARIVPASRPLPERRNNY